MTPNQQFILALFAAILPVVGLILAAILKINALHSIVNSRLTQLLDATRKVAKAAGVEQERDEADARRAKKK